MKKIISLILCCTLVLALAGCAGTTVVVGNCTCPPEAHEPVEVATEAPVTATEAPAAPAESGLKTGLAIVTSLAKSASATAEAAGKADFDVTVVAVTVDANGIIRNCAIDSVGKTVAFDAEKVAGEKQTEEVLSKNELGFAYGMSKVKDGIGKEWFEQAAALAAFAEGKTMEQVKAGVAGGFASDADLATSATIYLGGYVSAMEVAVANARELGASVGDELKLAVSASVVTGAGNIQLNLDAAALTLNGETITSAFIDSLEAPVGFNAEGVITEELTTPKTKNEKGFDYGMVAYKQTPIGKEWFEQVAYFCDYITGKTLADVAAIAVNEATKTTDVDLATGCTIAIGGFQKLIAKIAG